jgi:hypothetical protein
LTHGFDVVSLADKQAVIENGIIRPLYNLTILQIWQLF